jgi:IS30 family transposase
MRGRPVSDDEIATIRRMHGDGATLGAIARELGRAAQTVSQVCKRMGLTFDRKQTAAANAAASVDMAARRNALATNLLADAERIREQLWAPTTVYNFGGKDNNYNERVFPEAPADVKRTLMQTATTAVNAHLRLVDYAARDSHDEARDVVLQFALAVRNAELPDDPPPAD